MLPLQPGELRVYYAFCDLHPPELQARRLAMLSQAEREQHERFHFEHDKSSYLAAHALTRTVLGRLLGVEPSRLAFELGPRGRPELCWPSAQPRLRFNLSHTRGLVACALALEADVGVDVEDLERAVEIDQLAPRVFSVAERARLSELDGPAKRRRFFELWTLKEAYLKAVGVGLGLPLQEITLEVDGARPRLALGAAIGDDGGRWFLEQRSLAQGYLLAAALALPAPTGVSVEELSPE